MLNPRSEELESAWKLEIYDRAIANPGVDQEEVTKDFLFGAYSIVSDPDKYIKSQDSMLSGMGLPQPQQGGMPEAQNAPLNAVAGLQGKLPQSMPKV